MELPEEILAHIFSFLSLKDKCNASLVCKTWSTSLTCPSAWTHTEIRCESGVSVPHGFSNLLSCIRHLKLIINLVDPVYQATGLQVLQEVLAGGDGRLRGLCLGCSGSRSLFYAGQDLLQGLVDVLTSGSSLTALDLRDVPFTLSDSFVKSVAALCPALRSLFINNSSLVCGVSSGTISYVLKCCPALNTAGLFQASVSHDVLRDILQPERTEMKLLELRCERSLKYVTQLCDEIWADVRRRHPGLRVDLELDHTLPELQVPGVLQPSIPVRQLRLHTWTCLLDEIRVVAQCYAGTLEVLELQTTSSSELNEALMTLATQCTKLREVHCYCVVSQNVIEAFCSLCPDLRRYTLKTRKELHPWTCTTLR